MSGVGVSLGVAAAGALGATARYAIERAIQPGARPRRLPVASYVINPLGSFLLGVVVGLASAHGLSEGWRAVLGTGFCGAFTVVGPVTFDSVRVFAEGAPRLALAHALAGTAVPLLAATVGLAVAGGI
ncbi:MAG TPA: CrcB family protein [Acidimicrobiia bacterium]|nr:CrcB family protein [Acidimicrobiia bacterium]